MAYAARLEALAGELIEAVTGASAETDADAFTTCRAAVVRSLKSHSYLRTNQFEVAAALDGLEERFQVNCRDDLAASLRTGLDELEIHPEKWHPEILLLLLELSDQPTTKANVADLELLRVEDEASRSPLRWADIAREDGWDPDDPLWQSISYSEGSEDDDVGYDSQDDSEPTSVLDGHDAYIGRAPEDYVIHPEDAESLAAIQEAQSWRHGARESSTGSRKIAITEVQAVREVLFMLHGLPTSLFDQKCDATATFQIEHLAWQTHQALISTFSEFGRQLRVLRTFVHRTEHVSYLQSLQDCISTRLDRLDLEIASIQARYASPKDELVVSLVACKAELEPHMEPLFLLVKILHQLEEATESEIFLYLELLFDEVSIAQTSGKADVYRFLAEIFVECFNVYLQPIRRWMDNGRLRRDDETFFVYEPAENISLPDTWRSRFKLRTTPDGRLHGPKFLHAAVNDIYNAGKNIVVLRLLGRYESAEVGIPSDEPPLDMAAICPPGGDLAPFQDLFSLALDRWIQSKYRKTSTTLKETLFDDWSLSSVLDTLQYLYLMSNGTASCAFAEDLFANLDALNTRWHDRFALTAASHEAFAQLVDISRLSAKAELPGTQPHSAIGKGSVKHALAAVKIEYRLPWPLKMIISDESLAQYQSIFTFLLQIRRAQYILGKSWMSDDHGTGEDDWAAQSLFYAARNKLAWFNTTMQTYLATLVLGPNDVRLRQDLAIAQDVDAMIHVHSTYTKRMLGEACLGQRLAPIHDAMIAILDLSINLERVRDESKKQTQTLHGDGHAEADDINLDRKDQHHGVYVEALRAINAGFSRNLNFICGGLRSVARASGDTQSSKWDFLADMLQTGSGMDVRGDE